MDTTFQFRGIPFHCILYFTLIHVYHHTQANLIFSCSNLSTSYRQDVLKSQIQVIIHLITCGPGLTGGYLRVFKHLYLQRLSDYAFFLLRDRKQGTLQTPDCWDYRPLKELTRYIQRGIDGMIPQKLTFVILVVFLLWGLFVYWIRF